MCDSRFDYALFSSSRRPSAGDAPGLPFNMQSNLILARYKCSPLGRSFCLQNRCRRQRVLATGIACGVWGTEPRRRAREVWAGTPRKSRQELGCHRLVAVGNLCTWLPAGRNACPNAWIEGRSPAPSTRWHAGCSDRGGLTEGECCVLPRRLRITVLWTVPFALAPALAYAGVVLEGRFLRL